MRVNSLNCVRCVAKKGSSSTAAIPRSSSFDTLSSTYYLSGTWPRVGVPRGRSSSSAGDSISDAQPQVRCYFMSCLSLLCFLSCMNNSTDDLHCVSKKQDTRFLSLPKRMWTEFWNYLMGGFRGKLPLNQCRRLPPHFNCFATPPREIWIFQILANNHQTFIPDIKINLFYMKLNRLNDTRENSDDTVYKNIQ